MIDGATADVIHAQKPERPQIIRHESSAMMSGPPLGHDVAERAVRRLAGTMTAACIDGISWVLRSGAPWSDRQRPMVPARLLSNRFVRWMMDLSLPICPTSSK